MQKKKRIYWLTNPRSALVETLEQELRHHGYHCDFFSSIDALMSATAARRTTIIVLGNLDSIEKENSALKYLAQRPELQGVRFILAPSRLDHPTLQLAGAFNFRDILPLDLPAKLWAERFIFATSTNPTPLTQNPAQVGINQLATVHVPTRVVWISRNQIWLESRLEAPPGTTVTLRGSLTEAVGLSGIKLEVLGSRKKYLFYRFSNALICQWDAPEKFRKALHHILTDLKKNGPGPICRVFMAVESAKLRGELIDALPAPSFKLTAALQKHGIPIEPRYFSPNVVLIEDKLITGDGGSQFADLMNSIEPTTPVLILGEGVDLPAITRTYHHRPVFMLPQKPPVVREAIRSRFFNNMAKAEEFNQPDLVYLPAEHILSFAEISVPARLTRIHPLRGTISTAYPIAQFALTQFESPVLNKLFGRPVFIKLTTSYKNPHPEYPLHPYVSEFSFSDLVQSERAALADALPEFVAEHMKAFNADGSSQGASHPIINPGSMVTSTSESSVNKVAGHTGPLDQNTVNQESATVAIKKASLRKQASKNKSAKTSETETAEDFFSIVELPSLKGIKQRLLDTVRDQKKKFSNDPTFRLGIQTLMAIALILGIIVLLVRVYEPFGRESGKIWSDSFKQYRDRQNP